MICKKRKLEKEDIIADDGLGHIFVLFLTRRNFHDCFYSSDGNG